MKVLITGGTGFIGSRLALKCLEKGDSVRVFGQENTPAEIENRKIIQHQGAEFVAGSVTEKGKIGQCMQDVDIVYHLAAAQHEMNIPDTVFEDVNVNGTRHMLEAGIDAGVKRFVHGSTIGVYGSSLTGNVDEASALQPDNIYGRTKLAGEKLVLDYKEKLPVVIIRISETYGPGDRRLLKLFKAISKGMFFIIGNGKNIHHLIYVDDLIQGLLQAATNDKVLGEILVLAGKTPLTTREMVDTVAQVLDSKVPFIRAPLTPFLVLATLLEMTMRPLGIQPPLHRRRMDFFRKSFRFSMDKADRLLGFEPVVDFHAGAEKTAAWYYENGHL